MEDIGKIKKIVRMNQVYAVGGTFKDVSDFTRTVNKNLVMLNESDKNCEIKDIKFNIYTDPRLASYIPVYLAFIIAEVDVDITPEPESKGKKKKKRKKKK
ncbi:MAG: hypothetical protein ACW986_17510 [Promethearchaeota archaeon]|jgi:hypothetical protein